VVATDVIQATNDKRQLQAMLVKVEALADELGKTTTLPVDNGYFGAANVTACAKAGIGPLIAMGRQPHYPPRKERLRERAGGSGQPHASPSHDASADRPACRWPVPAIPRLPPRLSTR
jgi:hypothetical protein